ncbi:unnamed protein product [Tilletia controversa]|uniref:DNA polymerase epsilon catalytic subunit n=2 Tax=Tilletia TaxID=13289 RepID=A0A177UPJ9_9BASI|nr:hypothetical protein CF336_g3201 [Tilletia laevis]KAE8262472.1 hypothetical protein A4X03_0g2433 [Tilletia caries]CAD6925151.1 unnamed protein product [Tilletia controversa]KAE8203207.1 hypothetical protein CF335_g3117 [Tilletia laevis]CAD6887281.1 unnamed protein product [Tilletia caries]
MPAPRTFGLTSSGPGRGRGGNSSGSGRGSFRRRGGHTGASSYYAGSSARDNSTKNAVRAAGVSMARADDGTTLEERFQTVHTRDTIDVALGFERLEHGATQEAWLVNMHPTLLRDEDGGHPTGKSAVDFYFIDDIGSSFKVTLPFQPYFLIGCRPGTETFVEEWLRRKYGPETTNALASVERIRKTDLSMPNHLLGYTRTYIRLNFHNVHDLLSVRRELLPLAQEGGKRLDAVDTYADVLSAANGSGGPAVEIGMDEDDYVFGGESRNDGGSTAESSKVAARDRAKRLGADPERCIIDIREYDVPYYLRVAIDMNIRVGLWYRVELPSASNSLAHPALTLVPDRVKRAEPVVLAFDIETTKAPLKFPDAEQDIIMMISYMIDGQGFLIVNREIVSEDIDDFEYNPKDEYEGPFTVFNEADEPSLIRRFFSHIQDAKPTVVATYNGDSFDFPFVETRAQLHGISMLSEIGFSKDNEGEYKSTQAAHMDCFRWVKRDSYLPQGSQGLKAVTVAKLGYDPMELDPELMTPYAIEQPQILAQYSVSDAVATYYLYMKYVHPFVFSLCNIIPLNPDEVLRKGSGTLCETLLMVQAYQSGIVMPNRHVDPVGNTYEGHLLESETYVGGHVEALEAGVFRSDIPTHFKLEPKAVQQLIDDLDSALKFSITEEGQLKLDDVTNYDEVKCQIQTALETLRDNPLRQDNPLIYHLDVAAMYPNIMLSNRLQPDSMVTEATCATCDYNRPGMQCDRRMDWAWRGEFFPAKRDELNMIKHALASETFPPRWDDGPRRSFHDLSQAEQTALIHKRVGDYSRKVYKKTHETKTVVRQAIVCQRENPFYIDTVRDFRDRRYEYKGLHKTWKKNLDAAAGPDGSLADVMEAKKMIVLYDSLQLAHKCILNSFYGYVMRKGARWFSMEMAGITCLTGAKIIQMAKDLVDKIGRPLELDTDGIWCMLPGAFPEDFKFETKGGKKFGISYPCTMLNHLVHERFTNHQYHDLANKETGEYKVHSENSIFFELDGPYRAMILPSSKEEDKLLKKRYAVFNPDGSLAELKGFEVKRRGELQLIKDFQKQIFSKFLMGETLVECYAAVAKVADQWLDVLYSKGSTLHDRELIDLIGENKSMSKTLLEYGSQKSTAITTAKRLAEVLGAQMVKDKGLACKFIISAKPHGAPVTERAVPLALFSAEESVKHHYLRRFLKDQSLTDFNLRSILDWNYYIERFAGVIQKLITIPAAMQKVPNPVPRVRHPEWLFKRITQKEDKFKQRNISDLFAQQRAKQLENGIVGETQEETEARLTVEREARAEKKRAEAEAVRLAEEAELNQTPPPLQEYSGWVAVVKKRWRKRIADRQEELRQLGGPMQKVGKGRMATMISRRTASMASARWDIVQITPGSRPGEYRFWVMVDDQLQSLRLLVPREFYINFKSQPQPGLFKEEYQVESVVKTLPRGATCRHLYRVTVPEDQYLEDEVYFSAIINNPNIEGVYEMQVPLDVRALIKLGSSCAIDPARPIKLGQALDSGFPLSSLQKSPLSAMSKRRYMNQGANIRYFYLYHANRDGRHLFGLFGPEGEAKIHVVDASELRQVPNLENMYADRIANMREKGKIVDGEGVFEYQDSLQITFKVHPSATRAFKALAKDLTALRTVRQTAALLAICTSKPQSYYEQNIGNAVQEFPMLSIHAARAEDDLPALNWQLYSVRRMFNCYFRTSVWLERWFDLAEHLDVPVCNLERDFALFGADLDFARRLQKHDMVLWWSRTPAPDLGGREEDSVSQQRWDGQETLEVSHPGCYSNVTFEVSLGDLALNAVLQSGVVNELEGSGTGSMAFDAASHTLDEYSKGTVNTSVSLGDSVLTSQLFMAVKAMVRGWYGDKVRGKQSFSALLADNFWRWASNAASALFEPALQRFLHGLMRKVLLQLLAEFKRLGTSIVYASFNRIFLLTNKPTAGSAAAYGRYLMSAVTSRELFKHLTLDIVHYWEYLLWLDVANFGGVISADPDQLELSERFDIEMNWNIQVFLPPVLQPRFSSIIGSYIYQLHENKRKATDLFDRMPLRMVQEQTANGATTATGLGETEVGGLADAVEPVKSKEEQFARDLINHTMTRKLLKTVHDIQQEYDVARPFFESDPQSLATWSFPQLPGSHLKLRSPTLEFIKNVCAVLSLGGGALASEVQICKRNLLDLIGVREFAPEAEWRNPCEPFKLGLVICEFCNDDRSMDLCRDADLLNGNTEWRCSKCDFPYDRAAIEARLIDVLNGYLSSFALQDLRCMRCGMIRADNMGERCSCSGGWGLVTTRREAVHKIRALGTIATWHGFETLKMTVDQVLELV